MRGSTIWSNLLPGNPSALAHALERICRNYGLPHITPHGLRSFYVTKRRSDGASDIVIAGEIGDRTAMASVSVGMLAAMR
jgi:hypothetical protein